jgi:hypothetical protein
VIAMASLQLGSTILQNPIWTSMRNALVVISVAGIFISLLIFLSRRLECWIVRPRACYLFFGFKQKIKVHITNFKIFLFDLLFAAFMLGLGVAAIAKESQLSAFGYGSTTTSGYNAYTFGIAGVNKNLFSLFTKKLYLLVLFFAPF